MSRARTVGEAKAIRDQAEAIRVYTKSARKGLAVQNRAAAIKIFAERRAGELLAKLPRLKERRAGVEGPQIAIVSEWATILELSDFVLH